MRYPASNFKGTGFTLAELLIALAILGVIATFTVPKVLQAQNNNKFNAIAKEVAGMMSGAYDAYKLRNSASSSTTTAALTPYMNYVAVDSSTIVDDQAEGSTATQDCANVINRCLKLHNGAMLRLNPNISFAGTNTTNPIWFMLDPDGVTSSNRSVQIFLYFNGRIATRATIEPSTIGSDGSRDPMAYDPAWFSWSN